MTVASFQNEPGPSSSGPAETMRGPSRSPAAIRSPRQHVGSAVHASDARDPGGQEQVEDAWVLRQIEMDVHVGQPRHQDLVSAVDPARVRWDGHLVGGADGDDGVPAHQHGVACQDHVWRRHRQHRGVHEAGCASTGKVGAESSRAPARGRDMRCTARVRGSADPGGRGYERFGERWLAIARTATYPAVTGRSDPEEHTCRVADR